MSLTSVIYKKPFGSYTSTDSAPNLTSNVAYFPTMATVLPGSTSNITKASDSKSFILQENGLYEIEFEPVISGTLAGLSYQGIITITGSVSTQAFGYTLSSTNTNFISIPTKIKIPLKAGDVITFSVFSGGGVSTFRTATATITLLNRG